MFYDLFKKNLVFDVTSKYDKLILKSYLMLHQNLAFSL